MRIIKQEIDNKLVKDYMNERMREYYPYHYKDKSAWQKKMDKVGHLIENGYAIVTGQQVGLFTGPLYTIYKALTAIKLANYLSCEYKTKFIPIFWIESNDHDIAEVNHINLLDSESNLLRLEYTPSRYVSGMSMNNAIIEEDFSTFINELKRHFHDTEYVEEVFEIIRESYGAGISISAGFARMMSRLFAKYGLVIIDPSDIQIKRLMTPIFAQEIEEPLRSTKSINAIGERLRTEGYDSQIELLENSTCMFIEENGIRRKLYYEDGNFKTIDNSWTKEELLEILETEPQKFSPNVALRPVIQDYLLGTVAYSAGPGEISYFAQLREVYDQHGVDMPIIYPRASMIIIENKIQRIISAYNLEISDLAMNHEELFSKISRQNVDKNILSLLENSRHEVEKIFERLIEELSDTDLRNITESARKKIDYQFNVLKEKAYQIQRSKDEILRKQIRRACMNIYPDGKPQERVFNIVQYLVLYGIGFIEELMEAI